MTDLEAKSPLPKCAESSICSKSLGATRGNSRFGELALVAKLACEYDGNAVAFILQRNDCDIAATTEFFRQLHHLHLSLMTALDHWIVATTVLDNSCCQLLLS